MKRFLMLCILMLAATPLFAQSVYYSSNAAHQAEVTTAANLLASSLGGTATGFAANNDAAWATAIANANVIWVGQSSGVASLAAGTVTDIATWVSGGGVLLTLRDQPNVDVMNTVLGTSMVIGTTYGSSFADTIKQVATAGSSFDSAPAALTAASDHGALAPASVSGSALVAYVSANVGAWVDVMVQESGSGVAGYLSWDWCCSATVDERAAWDAALYSAATYGGGLVGEEGVARFNVVKTFEDEITAPVDVMLTCNGGLPLEQSFTIDGGDPAGVTFVVTDLPETGATCTVTESGGPDGYTPVMNGGAGCSWTDVTGGLYTCAITNEADPATFIVNKVWEVNDEVGGDDVIRVAEVTITCDAEIEGGYQDDDDRSEKELPGGIPWPGFGDWMLDETIVGDGSVEATVDTSMGPVMCEAEETSEQSGVESTDDCDPREIGAGETSECTITNTVFFEGIPSLNRYGLAIMALLMLGMGMVGFRRFV